MKTVNSLSGGKTSSYMAANYPADYDVFALVRIEDERCKFPDKKLRQEVEDRIQAPFIGTAEDDMIIYTMLDLEQYIGRKITWVTGKTFDEIIVGSNGKTFIPQASGRFCTTEMKLEPISEWWLKEVNETVDMRIGFRANETRRSDRMISKLDDDGTETLRIVTEVREDKRNLKAAFKWRTVSFPLIEDNIYKDNVEEYWKGKDVRFAWQNNCIGCFHNDPVLLKKKSEDHPEKFEWFIRQEEKAILDYDRRWLSNRHEKITYKDIKGWGLQFDLFDDDFNDCDSGYCGI